MVGIIFILQKCSKFYFRIFKAEKKLINYNLGSNGEFTSGPEFLYFFLTRFFAFQISPNKRKKSKKF